MVYYQNINSKRPDWSDQVRVVPSDDGSVLLYLYLFGSPTQSLRSIYLIADLSGY